MLFAKLWTLLPMAMTICYAFMTFRADDSAVLDYMINIRNGMKRVRKKESSFVLASQNIEDFLLPEIKEFTKPLFSIPSHHFLFFPGNISPVDLFMLSFGRSFVRTR